MFKWRTVTIALLGWTITGCVTRSDLVDLRNEVDWKLKSAANEVRTIRTKLEALQTKREETAAAVQSALEDVRKELREVRQERAAFNANLQRLDTLSKTLLRNYQLEAQTLRAHLNDIDQMAKDLEAFSDGDKVSSKMEK
jgi:outer membrane murein-binding lipoprotein Lpp